MPAFPFPSLAFSPLWADFFSSAVILEIIHYPGLQQGRAQDLQIMPEVTSAALHPCFPGISENAQIWCQLQPCLSNSQSKTKAGKAGAALSQWEAATALSPAQLLPGPSTDGCSAPELCPFESNCWPCTSSSQRLGSRDGIWKDFAVAG